MYCNNCGQEVPNNSGFCPNCGAKINPQNQTAQDAQSTEPRTIKLRCKNCNATMEVDASKQEAVCPYCGAKEKILDSDAVAVEKIKSNTYKEMEYARMEKEEKQNAKNQKEQEKKAYSKSFLSKFTIIMMFICLICTFTAFGSKHILAGIIALIQTVIFAVSWLMGKQIIGENKKAVYKALALLGCLLIIPFSITAMRESVSKLEWPKSGLADKLPKPDSQYGEIDFDEDDFFEANVEKTSADDYRSYIKACEDKGFTVDAEKSNSSYTAADSEGYKLDLYYNSYDKESRISLDAPKQETDSANQTDSTDTIEADTDATDTGTDTTTTTDNSGSDNPATTDSTTDSGSVTPELKEFLDSYESFMDEYIAFMQKYNSSSDTLGMATDYAKMLAKYAGFSKKADAYNTDEMSSADAAYYLDVMNRVNKKLADAALN